MRAVNEALAGEDVTVDRVLVAQPSWRKRELAMSFDRQAWVLLAAGADMKAALRALKEHRFTCPGPVDTATGLPIKGFTFRVSAAKHMPRGGTPLPAYMSAPRRVAADTWRALRIAHLLDTERDIPAESRLSYLLSPRTSTALVLQMRSPADVLDTAIAYLRRVHFVAYYAGLRFHDEAHLLSMPSEFVRSEAYCLPPPPPPSAGPGALVAVESEVTEGAAATAAAPPDLKAVSEDGSAGDSRKRRRDSDAEEGDEDAAQGRRGKRSRSEDSADGHVSESAGGDLSAGIDEAGEEAVSESSSGLTAEQREATEKIEAWKRVVKAVRGRIGSAQIDRLVAAVVMFACGPVLIALSRRLDAIKDDLAARLRRTAKGAAASADDADAKSIQRLHDEVWPSAVPVSRMLTCLFGQLLDGFVKENCTVQEDGRARCGLESCGKLFKDAEFLEKHIRSKHIALARVRLVDRSVEFTRSRFEADSLGYRPLPLVNVEVSGGVERRSVKEIVDSAHAGLLSLGALDGDRRASRDADRRISGPRPPPPAGPVAPALGSQPPLPSGAAPEPARKISYYVDVDEPKVMPTQCSSCVFVSISHRLVKAWTLHCLYACYNCGTVIARRQCTYFDHVLWSRLIQCCAVSLCARRRPGPAAAVLAVASWSL